MKPFIIESFLVVGVVMLAWDNWALRKRLRVDRLAREAEEALGPPRIGDIDMPDPSDPRWKEEQQQFGGPNTGKVKTQHVLALGQIAITDRGTVYIGAGEPIADGQRYGKRVITAYRQRLVNAAKA